jgi:predicted pyridoxine 5'-phosphate oxidase superfamily flavin-nucleotide-binding protein
MDDDLSMESANPTGVAGSVTERLIQTEYGTAERAGRFYDAQVLDHLNARMREFVGRQEMMFLSTADAAGHCDSTFRAGPPGFVTVLSAVEVAWPEYRGNGVMASLANITDNAHAGLLFVDFFRDVIGLHVNGRARIVADGELRAAHPELPADPIPGRRAERWVKVGVQEAYVHCRKHIPQLIKIPRQRAWGGDDSRAKGGDFFHVAGGD